MTRDAYQPDIRPAKIPIRDGITLLLYADRWTLGTVLGTLLGGVDLLALIIALFKVQNPLPLLVLAAMAFMVLLFVRYSLEN